MLTNNRIASFYKVSFEQFLKDYCNNVNYAETAAVVRGIWDNIRLPIRKTKGSAGYDFKSTIDFSLEPSQTIIIPTGIRVKIEDGWVLQMCPRSSLGFKYRSQLDNTIGIIDSDYFYSDNEGHIMIKLTNDSKSFKVINVKEGDSIVQGIFLPYGITIEDKANGVRNGGFGSTNNQ